MKTTAISNSTRQNNINNNNKNRHSNINFKGFADGAVVFWNFIDKCGRGAQFTVEDMLGTNLPRTYQGARAGYKYTGKVNMPALIQEAIREFLTGPTMTLAPIGILAISTQLNGKSAKTHIENIVGLSNLTSNLPKENIDGDSFKEALTQAAVRDMLRNSTGKDASEETVKDFTQSIIEYGNISKKAKTKADKKNAKQYLKQLQQKFESTLKSTKDNLGNTSLETAIHSVSKDKKGSTRFSNYIEYINAYEDDYIKKNLKNNVIDLSDKTIQNFKHNWIGKRAITLVSMIGLTITALSVIPKLYTLASGKINPNAANIYNEAKKKEGK